MLHPSCRVSSILQRPTYPIHIGPTFGCLPSQPSESPGPVTDRSSAVNDGGKPVVRSQPPSTWHCDDRRGAQSARCSSGQTPAKASRETNVNKRGRTCLKNADHSRVVRHCTSFGTRGSQVQILPLRPLPSLKSKWLRQSNSTGGWRASLPPASRSFACPLLSAFLICRTRCPCSTHVPRLRP